MYMILCVIDQPDQLAPVMKALYENGLRGVTVLESTGLHRLTQQMRIPMRYAFGSTSAERGNNTIFTVVETEETIQRFLEVIESVVGDFNGPNTGIFIAWPLSFTKGLSGKQRPQQEQRH